MILPSPWFEHLTSALLRVLQIAYAFWRWLDGLCLLSVLVILPLVLWQGLFWLILGWSFSLSLPLYGLSGIAMVSAISVYQNRHHFTHRARPHLQRVCQRVLQQKILSAHDRLHRHQRRL